MMRITYLLALAAVCVFSGCESPTKAYVKQHPELSPEHRKIISTGRIKFGDPVAGMTRDQIRLVMGTDPDQFDSINGEDAWIWLKAKTARLKENNDSDSGLGTMTGGKHHENESAADSGQTELKTTKVTVFFKGNIATRAEFGGGTL
jgi:hypothetical protein